MPMPYRASPDALQVFGKTSVGFRPMPYRAFAEEVKGMAARDVGRD